MTPANPVSPHVSPRSRAATVEEFQALVVRALVSPRAQTYAVQLRRMAEIYPGVNPDTQARWTRDVQVWLRSLGYEEREPWMR